MKNKSYYIIDFDSTFTQVEALEELVRISLAGHPEKESVALEIEKLTNEAMNGTLSFQESLEKRVRLLKANKSHLIDLIKVLRNKVSISFNRNKAFFKSHQHQVYIVSGGFREFIIPVVTAFGIREENVFANTFTYDDNGQITGFDKNNPLSEEGGKVKLIRGMNFDGPLFGIGDGHSDYQLKESGLIQKFFAFTENISREKVVKNADHITPSFDEFLYLNNLPQAISYPKNRILSLLIGEMKEESIELFKKDGLSIREKTTLEKKYRKDIGVLLLNGSCRLTDEELEECYTLKVIGCLGNASQMLPLELATKMGIVVFDDTRNKPKNTLFIPKRMIDFINKGSTYLSTNFPSIQLQSNKGTHRFIHIHRNMPGIIARINQVMADHSMNIEGQYLKTNKDLGYVITDVNMRYDPLVISDLKKIEHTIKFRILY